jgi:hypothetical protein
MSKDAKTFPGRTSNGFVPQETKKADMAEHPKESCHVGLLVNEPPGKSRVALHLVIRRLLFIV